MLSLYDIIFWWIREFFSVLQKSDENQNIPGVSDTDMFLFIIILRENGTESGLGISVKGKTVADDDGVPVDLGLFVKNVMEGGAAARVR